MTAAIRDVAKFTFKFLVLLLSIALFMSGLFLLRAWPLVGIALTMGGLFIAVGGITLSQKRQTEPEPTPVAQEASSPI